MSGDLESELTSALHLSATSLGLNNYEIDLNTDRSIGDGFSGELYKASIINNDTKEETKLVLKKAPRLKNQPDDVRIVIYYTNEICFYSKLLPAFQELEKKHAVEDCFNSVPQYITSISDLGKEIIVLKDITFDGYQMSKRNLFLDDEHVSSTLKVYGHFHALSFCLKNQEPEKFKEVTQPIISIWEGMIDIPGFEFMVSHILNQSYQSLDQDTDGPIREQFQKYVSNGRDIFKNSASYTGKYSVLLHGDCWSNNIMFKYQDSENRKDLQQLKILDFQQIFTGTPVYDLAYFLYTGGSVELFKKLDSYLDIYYDSFAKAVSNLGDNPEDLLPREELRKDWKEYAKFGMIAALLLTQVKLMTKEETAKMITDMEKDGINLENMEMKADESLFKERASNIIRHMYEIDAL